MDGWDSEYLEVAKELLVLAVPAYVEALKATGTVADVLGACRWGDVVDELLLVVQEQGTLFKSDNDPLVDALFAVATEMLPDLAATLRAVA